MTDEWHSPPNIIQLLENEVHVWYVPLDVSAVTLRHLQQTLSIDELSRVERFHLERDRYHWIIARGVLRRLLAQYLQRDPGYISFSYNQYGKPELLLPSKQRQPLHFNVSHSHNSALYAFAYRRHVGVDIEYINSHVDYDAMARYSFSEAEYDALCLFPPEKRRRAFFQGWTRKEAYVKARGIGLVLPMKQFSIVLEPGVPTLRLSSNEDLLESERWSLQEITLGAEYAGALAVEFVAESPWQLKCWTWQA